MKYVTILGVLAILVAVLAYYMFFAVSPDSKLINDQVSVDAEKFVQNETSLIPLKGTGTLESLRLLNKNLECTILHTPSNQTASVEGTYFVSEGNIRGDFLTDSPDLSGQILSSVIINETTMYTWTEIEGDMYGTKMNLSTVDETKSLTKQSVSLDSSVKYDCKNWENVDRTVFVPPSEVLFKDVSEIIQTGMEYGTVYEE